MLFDNGFDRTLWLLVAGNKKDSKNVCRLISFIPENICNNIQNAIKKYCNGNIKDSIIYKDTYNGIEGFDYYIVVKYIDNYINNVYNLDITLYRWKEEDVRIEEEYNLVLKYIPESHLVNMLYLLNTSIGYYSSEVNNIKFMGYLPDVDKVNYDRKFFLKRVPLRFIVSSYFGNRVKGNRVVNVNKNMPSDINYGDFYNQESINNLVRKRKKTK